MGRYARNFIALGLLLLNLPIILIPDVKSIKKLEWSTTIEKEAEYLNLLDPTPQSWIIELHSKTEECNSFRASTDLVGVDYEYLASSGSWLPMKGLELNSCPDFIEIKIISMNNVKKYLIITDSNFDQITKIRLITYSDGMIKVIEDGKVYAEIAISEILINYWPGQTTSNLKAKLKIDVVLASQPNHRLLVMVLLGSLIIFLLMHALKKFEKLS